MESMLSAGRKNAAAPGCFGIKPVLRAAAIVAAGCIAMAANALAAEEPPAALPQTWEGTIDGPLFTPAPHQNISGIWRTQRYMPKLELMDGGELPFNDAGRAKYAANMEGLANGTIRDDARITCVPDGLPRILSNPYPMEIIQTPGQVTFVYELNHVIRPILLDRPQASAEDLEIFPYYMGHTAAHWEGDTLVIEAAGFNERTFLDAAGAPHGYELRTTERYRKLPDGTLEVVITITDAQYYMGPFSVRVLYDPHPEMRLQDYNCGDVHRDISDVPGVVPRN